MFRIKTQTKTFFVVTILLIVSIFDFYAYYIISDQDSRVVQSMSDLDQEMKKSLNLDKVKKVVKETEISRGQIQNYFIPAGGEVGFIESLESIGRISSVEVKVDNVDLGSAKDWPGISTAAEQNTFQLVKVRLSVIGNWNNVNRYWQLLENLPYRVSFDHISLLTSSIGSLTDKKVKDSNRGPVWQIGFDVSVLKKK
jgi:hypothetical protein